MYIGANSDVHLDEVTEMSLIHVLDKEVILVDTLAAAKVSTLI